MAWGVGGATQGLRTQVIGLQKASQHRHAFFTDVIMPSAIAISNSAAIGTPRCWDYRSLFGLTRGYAESGRSSPAKLNDIVNLDKFKGLAAEECIQLWLEVRSRKTMKSEPAGHPPALFHVAVISVKRCFWGQDGSK